MAQTEPSQSTKRDAGTNPAEGFGRFKVDLADHLDVHTIQRLSILLGLKPGEIESIKRSKTPGLEMVNLLDDREFITPTGITDLLKMLHKLKLAGLAERIQSSFQAKTHQGKKDQGLYLEEQEDKSGDVSSKGKVLDHSSVTQPSTSASDRVVTTATIQDLSEQFCDEWPNVGRKLRIGEPMLQAIDTDNITAQEKMYRMLSTWKRSKGNAATYRLLGEALQLADRMDLQKYLYQQVEQQEDKSSDVSSKGKAPDPSSVKQPSTSKRREDERVGTSTAGIEAPDLVVTFDTIQPPDVLTLLHESLQKVSAEMTRSDSENLANFFMFPLKHVKAIVNSPSHSIDLLVELEKKGIIQSALTDELCENLEALNILTGRIEGSKSSIDRPSSTLLKRKLTVEEEGEGRKSSIYSPSSTLFKRKLTVEEEGKGSKSSIRRPSPTFLKLSEEGEGSKSSIDRPSSTIRKRKLTVEGEGKGRYPSLHLPSPALPRFTPMLTEGEKDWKPPDTMKIKSSISEKGGLLQIPNTGIKLVFPPNAVTEERNIQVKIIPPRLLNEPATSFSSNSSVVLELLPNGLQLKREVSLTLPHCVTFANEEKAKAKVYVSHHEEGQRPRWEERPLSPYIFYRSKCTVRLLGFCWWKIEIDDREVVAKKIVVYAAKKILPRMETARVSYGYYEEIPGREPKILNFNANLELVQSLPLIIFKEGRQLLTISFNGTNPRNAWCTEQGNEKQEIPFLYLDLSEDFLVHFELQRRQSRDSFCKFTAQQGNSDPIKFSIEMEGYQPRGEIADSSVPDYILQYLAEELCSEWQSLARYLKISNGDLDNVKEDNRRCHQDTKYFMLHKWKKRNGTKATCRVLATALDKAGRTDLREYVDSQVPMQSGSEPTQHHGWFRGWQNWFKW